MYKTVRECILSREISNRVSLIRKLKRNNGPIYLLNIKEKELAELKEGKIDIVGETSLLDEPYFSAEEGRLANGKVYLLINRDIMYFPKGSKGKTIISI